MKIACGTGGPTGAAPRNLDDGKGCEWYPFVTRHFTGPSNCVNYVVCKSHFNKAD